MNNAITLKKGEKGINSAPPNPWVGCVLVKNGKIIGKGYHAKAGTAHAEVVAIKDAINNSNEKLIEGIFQEEYFCKFF